MAEMAGSGTYQVHVEARGPRWISWVTRGEGREPYRNVVLVAETEEKAAARAREWAASQPER